MSLLPSSPDVSPDGDPRVVGLDSEAADELMAALSSRTARRLLAELHEDPAPPGELAERVDTSLQNAQYHLGKLEDAGAVAVVGTAYSEKGREMQVYGPADSPLVIYAGEPERASGLRAALSRLFGGFAALAVGALAIQELFGRSLLGRTGEDAAPGSDYAGATPTASGDDGNGASGGVDGGGTPTESARESATETPHATPAEETAATPAPDDAAATPTDAGTPTTEAADAGGATPTAGGEGFDLDIFGIVDAAFGGGLPPGAAFFLGGATVLTLVVVATYVRAQP